MSASATFIRSASAPEWMSSVAGPCASVNASDYPDGTRALIAGCRYVLAGGAWLGPSRVESFDASAYQSGAVLQVTVPPGAVQPVATKPAPVTMPRRAIFRGDA